MCEQIIHCQVPEVLDIFSIAMSTHCLEYFFPLFYLLPVVTIHKQHVKTGLVDVTDGIAI